VGLRVADDVVATVVGLGHRRRIDRIAGVACGVGAVKILMTFVMDDSGYPEKYDQSELVKRNASIASGQFT
jgi:hypothetical protein